MRFLPRAAHIHSRSIWRCMERLRARRPRAVGGVRQAGGPVLIGADAGAASLADGEAVSLADTGKLLASLSGQKLGLDRASCPLLIANLASAGGAEIVWQDDPLIAMKACKNSAGYYLPPSVTNWRKSGFVFFLELVGLQLDGF